MKKIFVSFCEKSIAICDYIGLEKNSILDLVNVLPISFSLGQNPLGKVFTNIELHRACKLSTNDFVYTKTLIHGGIEKYRMYVKRFENEKFIFLEYDDMTIQINKVNLNIRIFVRFFNTKELRFFIKSLAFEYLFSRGWFAIHSAAFLYKNKTFIVVGQKGDGKTTLLLNLMLYCNDIKVISNDRTLICENGGWCIASGDSSIRITNETLNLLQTEYGNRVDDVFGKLPSSYESEKITFALKNIPDKIYKISDKLAGIIVCENGIRQQSKIFKTIPQYAIIDDEEEHPDWIGLFQRNQDIGKRKFLQQNFSFIYYERAESLYENAKTVINSLNSC